MKNYNTKDKDYKGVTKDMLHRKVHIFSNDTEIHAVYHLGEKDQHVTTEQLEKIRLRPDEYIFTPYLEFVNFY